MVASKASKAQNVKSKDEKKEKTPDESVKMNIKIFIYFYFLSFVLIKNL